VFEGGVDRKIELSERVTATSLRSFFAHSFELKPQVAGFLSFYFTSSRWTGSVTPSLNSEQPLPVNAEEIDCLRICRRSFDRYRGTARKNKNQEVSHIAKTLPPDQSSFEFLSCTAWA
jgi:hypothetical protein